MKRLVLCFVVLTVLSSVAQVEAVPIFFVNAPSGNSTNWTNSVTGLGGSINTNVNFDTHGLGALNPNFYTVSDGVTFSTAGPINTIQFGAGPGQANTNGSQPGEGLHAASNFLFGSAGSKTLTITFASPVVGAGLFTLDYFDTNSGDRMQISAFDGPGGTGTLLGSALSVNQNFQRNKLYFMGVSSSNIDIRSIQWSYSGAPTGDTLGIDDIRFATSSTVIPEPSTYLLFGFGILGIIGMGYRQRKKVV